MAKGVEHYLFFLHHQSFRAFEQTGTRNISSDQLPIAVHQAIVQGLRPFHFFFVKWHLLIFHIQEQWSLWEEGRGVWGLMMTRSSRARVVPPIRIRVHNRCCTRAPQVIMVDSHYRFLALSHSFLISYWWWLLLSVATFPTSAGCLVLNNNNTTLHTHCMHNGVGGVSHKHMSVKHFYSSSRRFFLLSIKD